MNEGSGKWSITRLDSGHVWIEFYDPSGTKVVARSIFDDSAIREFAEALDEVMQQVKA